MSRDLLQLIDLDQDLPGQRRFISCWVASYGGLYFLVDPGPPATADYLVASLEALHLPRVDYILLTHIHLDHAGATARILKRWPEARVYCHSVGRKHLVDPGRLWQGSLKVLGTKAEVYGEPGPVPLGNLVDETDLLDCGIGVIDTPGHAPHHVTFVCGENTFLGESAGTFSDLGQGPGTNNYYLRPATPPRFFPEVAHESLGKMLEQAPPANRLCFAHHGRFEGDGQVLLKQAQNQLRLWVKVVQEYLVRAGIQPRDEIGVQDLFAELILELKNRDPLYARGVHLPVDIRLREEDFTCQTLRGITGYLAR